MRYAHAALGSGWISGRGEYLERTTERLKLVLGHSEVVLTSSGTAAGHLVAITLKTAEHPPIVVPNNVYVAAWNTLLQEFYAGQLVACDADEATWNMREPGETTGPLLVVHNLGNIVNVPKLLRAQPWRTVVEDCCEAMFGSYENRPVGSAALCASLSFYANKTITSGEGGAFVTQSAHCADIARSAANQGATEKRYVYDRPGYNYRMTNVQAAILLGQLSHHQEILIKKKHVFDIYRAELPSDRVVLQKHEEGTAPGNWILGVRVLGGEYAGAERHFGEAGIEIRPMFPPIGRHDHLRQVRCDSETVAALLSKECFMVPSYPELTDGEVARVIETVRGYARSVQ